MPIEAGDFKNGLTVIIEGNLFQVIDFQHVKPGKGAALLKTKMKNLRNGNIVERNFNTTTRFDQAIIEKRDLQYSYDADGTYYFMDLTTFDTYELTEEVVGFAKNFLVEGCEVSAKFFEEEMLGLDLPDKMELLVTETTDAVAGNTASTATKSATLETGLVVRVPLFIKQGEKVIVSTSDGKYCSRAQALSNY